MSRQMGYLLDFEHPYITLDNNYIESVWWLLNRFFQEATCTRGVKIRFCHIAPAAALAWLRMSGSGLQRDQVQHPTHPTPLTQRRRK